MVIYRVLEKLHLVHLFENGLLAYIFTAVAVICGSVTTYGKYETEDQVNFTVYVPKVDEHFVGSLAVIPLQLLGYYVSVAKGLDVDKPRNLAKSVTVE